jgi:NAD(P)-dependent dehydrogenase (short-subunit alcohol dehydrogenase family)
MTQSTSLAGKTALVTGAATGIGKATASALAEAGARVVINHPHTPEFSGLHPTSDVGRTTISGPVAD